MIEKIQFVFLEDGTLDYFMAAHEVSQQSQQNRCRLISFKHGIEKKKKNSYGVPCTVY